jgi:hypothetical protein
MHVQIYVFMSIASDQEYSAFKYTADNNKGLLSASSSLLIDVITVITANIDHRCSIHDSDTNYETLLTRNHANRGN